MTPIELIQQVPQAVDSVKDFLGYGRDGILLAVLFFVVKTLRDTNRENAERSVAQQKQCDDRNDKTVGVVDGICDRFSDTTLKLQDGLAKMQEAQREASDKREERLHETLREFRTNPKG